MSFVVTGCDLSKLEEDTGQAIGAFLQDKSLVESFAADMKRTFPPDRPEYQKAHALYYAAREADDRVLGKINLAVATGDRGVTPDNSIATMRAATVDFLSHSTASLSPTDRGLPIVAALAVLPALQTIIAHFGKGKQPKVRAIIDKVRWREWDAIPATPDEDSQAQKRMRKGHIQ